MFRCSLTFILDAGRSLGRFQAAFLLSVLFLLLILPTGLLVRLGDPLRLRKGLPGWAPRPAAPPTLERFGHPF